MEFRQTRSSSFIPDGSPLQKALERTTHLGIGAHADDLESIAIPGILACYQDQASWFSGVVLTTGTGAPRGDSLAALTKAEYAASRAQEQVRAAQIGNYSAVIQLAYESAEIRSGSQEAAGDLRQVLLSARPSAVYTHNPLDNHPTHRAVCRLVLDVVRSLPADAQPALLAGLEFWGSLDWLPIRCRIAFDTSAHQELQQELLLAFPSQNEVKAYPQAVIARRKANATLHSTHEADCSQSLVLGLDLTPLLSPEAGSLDNYLEQILQEFLA